MRLLKLHSSGGDVKKWQSFLFGIGYEHLEADADFGPATLDATKDFQVRHDLLPADGIVGNKTYAAAAQLGFPIITENSAYPPKPDFPYPSNEQRARMLGTFHYTRNGDGSINIGGDWTQQNLVNVYIPQLIGIENAPKDGKIVFHKNGANQIKALFTAWEAAGLLHYVKTWAGTFNPRMIRGSSTAVSNHAYASAFDINAAWNPLGHTPPLAGEEGSVVPLVEIANDHGFFWGGHYTNRKDGMHFELAVLNRYPKSPPTLAQTVAAVASADKVILHEQNNSAAAVPPANPPPASPPESGSAADSGSPAAGETSAKNTNSSDDAPPILPDSKVVDIPQVVAETQPEKEVSGIKASFAGAVTFLTTSGAGLFALFQGVQKELICGLFGGAAAVGIIFVLGRFWYANKEKEREHTERMEREKRAHEVQLATINTAARKDLNTVNVVPMPIENSDQA